MRQQTQPDAAEDAADPPLSGRVAEAIGALLPEVLEREVADVSRETALMDALGMTSTTGLELILRLEEILELEISVEELDREHFETVGSLADYVAANLLEV